MKISRKAEYALRAVVILAAAPEDRPMQIQEMAETGGIPVKFLEQILLTLKRGGLLQSKRGVGGGYQLAKPARSITIGAIIETIDGSLCTLSESAESGAAFPGSQGLYECLRQIDDQVNAQLLNRNLEEILATESPDAMMAFGI